MLDDRTQSSVQQADGKSDICEFMFLKDCRFIDQDCEEHKIAKEQ
jgi:hypothetical protein